MPEIIILGRIGYDLYSEDTYKPLPECRTFTRYLGGSSGNMAVGLSRQGAHVGMIAALGADSLSEFLRNFLTAERVDISHVQTVPGFEPSLCLTEISPPNHFPQVFYRHDAVDTKLAVTPADLEYATSGKMFITNGTSLCASPSRESTYLAMERAKAAGCQVVMDVDFRAMSWPSPELAGLAVRLALPYVDVLIGNQPELMLVTGTGTLEEATAKLIKTVPMVVSKLGDQGTRVWRGNDAVFLPPYKVEVTSTIGAGDGFASGYLSALLRGESVEECLHHGNASAAIVVSRLSCSEAMPTLDEVRAMMAAQRRS
jgi:5-dehydro-2-deoxygluconokinase